MREVESKPGLVLGVLPNYSYLLQEATLEPGDALFLYTDGVTEATNAEDEFFTLERVRESLERCEVRSPAGVVSFMRGAVGAFVLDAPQADDMTMMAIRYLGRQA